MTEYQPSGSVYTCCSGFGVAMIFSPGIKLAVAQKVGEKAGVVEGTAFCVLAIYVPAADRAVSKASVGLGLVFELKPLRAAKLAAKNIIVNTLRIIFIVVILGHFSLMLSRFMVSGILS